MLVWFIPPWKTNLTLRAYRQVSMRSVMESSIEALANAASPEVRISSPVNDVTEVTGTYQHPKRDLGGNRARRNLRPFLMLQAVFSTSSELDGDWD